jgi:two-component system sensor histidine kinase/response regulator
MLLSRVLHGPSAALNKRVAVHPASMTISAYHQAPARPRELSSSLSGEPKRGSIRWLSRVRTKLFASFILFASFTILACGASVWLFDGFGSLFSRTIRRDFATFGSMVRLQEESSQLVQLTATLSTSIRQSQLAPVLDAIAAGREKAANAVVVLRRDGQMADRVDDIAAKLDHVFDQYKVVEGISAARIAAVERRVNLGAGVLAARDALDTALAGSPNAAERAELRYGAALGAALLSEASIAGTGDPIRSLRERFDAEAATLDRLAPSVAKDAPAIEPAAQVLVALGRGPNNLFDLRDSELRAIAAEAAAMRPVREEAAVLSGEFGRMVEEKRRDLDETMRSSAARLASTRVFLIVVAACSVLPCLVLTLIYVGRNVAGRLSPHPAAM